MVLAKPTSKNQLTLPKTVISDFPATRYFDVTQEDGSPQTSVGRGAAVGGSARIVAAQPCGPAGRAFT